MKVHIATSREVGEHCRDWALTNNRNPDALLVADPDESDVFISVMYAHLVSEEFISKRRCYNFHPGILPQYRGAGAFSWCIINGDKRCGVTLHEMDVDIDTGPIIQVRDFPVLPTDTAQTLHDKGMDVMEEMFQYYFHSLLTDDLYGKREPQGDGRTYYRKDLQKQRDLTRFVRAFEFGGKEPAYYTDRNGNKVELRW